MAVEWKLFERIESGKSLFAVESVSLIYNALTSILILFLYPKLDHPGVMLLERAGIVALTFALIFLYQAFPCRLTAFVRMVVQMSLLAYWYPDTYEFNRLFPNLDHLFASVEQAVFRCQPSVEFSRLFPSVWFSEPFNMGYFFYYPMMLIVTVYYFLCHFKWFEKICFVLVTSFFVYYLFYILVPAAGPQFYFPVIGADNVSAGVFPPVGDYFAHVAISTIVMIMAWRVSRKLAYILLPFYLLLCGATVYIQAHYLIDSVVGFVSSFFVYALASKMYRRWFASSAFGGKSG